MINPRFIPVLSMRNTGLVKTRQFTGGTYLGDAINTAAIFNSKMVDEIIVLDIDAPREQRGPRFGLVRDLATECFMPLTFGGGIRTLNDVEAAIAAGAEKVVLTTAFYESPELVEAAAARFGSQSIVVGLDVCHSPGFGNEVCVSAAQVKTGVTPQVAARRAVDAGAGELIVQSVDRDGMCCGYDLPLLRCVTEKVDVSVVALGGARSVAHMADAIVLGGASAAAAGSSFVFFGRLNAVLINVPSESDRISALEHSTAAARAAVEGV